MITRALAVLALAVAGFLYLQSGPPESTVIVTGAKAQGDGPMFMVTMDLQNDGAPVTLTEVTTPDGDVLSIMNAKSGASVVIPGGSKAQLAMDGVHLALRSEDFAPGTFQPIALTFDDGSRVTARVQRPEMAGMAMDHGLANGEAADPSPQVSILPPTVSASGFTVQLALENLEFVVVDSASAHVPGQGHGHTYLNGLKLGRLYADTFEIGALKPGAYTLTVGLNTNDHRPYLAEGQPVSASYSFTLP